MKLNGYRYHHIGIPTGQPVPGEEYIPHLKIHACGFEVAFIEHNGAPVEFLQFDGPEYECWPGEKDPLA